MLLFHRSTRTLVWVPLLRLLAAVLLLGVAGAVVDAGLDPSDLVFLAATAAAAGFAADGVRVSRRVGDAISVRGVRRTSNGQVDARKVEVTVALTGPNPRSAFMLLRLTRSGAGITVAVFSPSPAGSVCRRCRRIATAFDVPFDEVRWRTWMAGGAR